MRTTTIAMALLATLSVIARADTRATFEDLGDNDTFVNLEFFGSGPGPDFAGPDATGTPGMTGGD